MWWQSLANRIPTSWHAQDLHTNKANCSPLPRRVASSPPTDSYIYPENIEFKLIITSVSRKVARFLSQKQKIWAGGNRTANWGQICELAGTLRQELSTGTLVKSGCVISIPVNHKPFLLFPVSFWPYLHNQLFSGAQPNLLLKSSVFWDIMLCNPLNVSWCFGYNLGK
jgi:hypothetical protein